MRVGIDIRPVIFTSGGIHTYVRTLVAHLAKRPGLEQVLFASSPSGIDWGSAHIRERVIRFPHLSRWCERFWNEVLLVRALGRESVDVFHGARFFVPGRSPCPCAVTVHDCGFRRYPEFLVPGAARYFDRLTAAAVKRAGRIIAPSQSTAQDLVELYGADRTRIAVIPEAADDTFRPQQDARVRQEARRRYGLDRPFILCVSTIEPRKNLRRLVEAYSRLREKEDLDLVICGGRGWLYDDLLRRIAELGLGARVRLTGSVPGPDLAALYSACEAFVLPSLYEGFGLPALEAMQCGAAVICADNSSLKEYFGDAAMLADAHSVESLAAAMGAVLSDGGLRQRLRAASLNKAAEFSWERSAGRTAQVYAELCGPEAGARR